MTRFAQGLADRLVAAIVPQITAQAYSCGQCYRKFCYCRGIDAYYTDCRVYCIPGETGSLCGVGCSIRVRGAC
jgi:hypothetical protein